MQKLYFLLISLLFSIISIRANTVDSLFHVLAYSIKERPTAFAEKENRIFQLKEKLLLPYSEEENYNLLKEIMNEYSCYKIDSALHYSNKCVSTAIALNREDYTIESKLKKAYFLSFLCLFHESLIELEEINMETLPVSLQKEYLKTIIFVYHNKVRGKQNTYFKASDNIKIKQYCERYFEIESEETFDCLSLKAYLCYVEKDYLAAKTIVLRILDLEDLSPTQRAETLFNLGGVYLELGNDYIDVAKSVLAEAAILCCQYAITKNPPLLQLALLVVYDDYNQAYNYINMAIEDAYIFSVDHRLDMREKTYNEIRNFYYLKTEKQKMMLQVVLDVIVILSLIIFSILVISFRANRTLKRTRQELVLVNQKLKDSNRIKEVGISYFLNQYSHYIDKLTEHKKYVLRLINAGHSMDIIKKEITSSVNTKDDLIDLFSNFDKSILKLFPSFVQEVNLLLRPDKVYQIRNNPADSTERLNTELRILALLRLGIYDNKEIAFFFRFTVQTVYNYRSKAKSRAINESCFEEQIKNICKD